MSVCSLGLSCEPGPCEHGKISRKERCHFCEIQRQINALTDMYKHLSICIASLDNFRLSQNHINSNIKKKMEIIRDNLKNISDMI